MPVIPNFADTAGFAILLNEHIADHKKNNKVKPRALCVGGSWRQAASYNSMGHLVAAELKVQTLAWHGLCHVLISTQFKTPKQSENKT